MLKIQRSNFEFNFFPRQLFLPFESRRVRGQHRSRFHLISTSMHFYATDIIFIMIKIFLKNWATDSTIFKAHVQAQISLPFSGLIQQILLKTRKITKTNAWLSISSAQCFGNIDFTRITHTHSHQGKEKSMIIFVRHTAQQLPFSSPEAQTELLALLRIAVAGDSFAVNLPFLDSLIDAGQQAGDVGVEHEVGEQTATPGVNWIVEQL